jgi:hypothetical protein
MGLFKGGALRLLQTALYTLIFCCAGIILGKCREEYGILRRDN